MRKLLYLLPFLASLSHAAVIFNPSRGYNAVADEGSFLTSRSTINFTGAGVSCVDSGSRTVCTISGGSADNLGNHVATTTLNMAGFDIIDASEIAVEDADSVQNIQVDHSALPRAGGFGPQVVDSQIYAQSFIDSGAAGYFLIATSTQAAFDTSKPVAYMQLSGDAASPSVIFVSDPGSGAQTILGVYPTYASVNNGAAFRWYNTTGDFVGLVSSSTISGNPTFTLPASLGTAGQVLKTDGASGNLYFDAVATTTLAGFSTDGAGSAITAGSTNYLYIPQGGTITGWTLLADTTGSVVIDVKKCAGYNCDPVTSIAGSEKPTLSAVWANQDASLSSWTTALTAGDKLAFVIDSAATVTKLHLSITGYR